MKKYRVLVQRFGVMFVEAEDEETAERIAGDQSIEDIHWDDDWEIADSVEDDSYDDYMYIRE
ncbi:MAG: hypothetical protein IIZ78_20715 [Clostridiales bacterium]|nr:hypothetical protein [Clostridiales bacterium]